MIIERWTYSDSLKQGGLGGLALYDGLLELELQIRHLVLQRNFLLRVDPTN